MSDVRLLGDRKVSMTTYEADPIAAELWICDVCGRMWDEVACAETENATATLVEFGRNWLIEQIHAPQEAA